MPSLMRFYPGTTAVAWLHHTPMRLVRACLAMLPRLTAEESLLEARRHAVGGGHLKSHVARGILRDWAKAATPQHRQRAHKPSASDLRGIGIGVFVKT